MIANFFKNNIKNILAIGIFVVISCVVYSPAIQGYAVKQADISSHRGMAKELRDYREMTGDEAIWTNSMFGGMPGYQMNVVYNSGVKWIYKVISLGLPHPISFVFISLLCFYFLGRVLNVHYLVAILGAIMYTFVTYNVLILEAGHNTKMLTVAYYPGVLAAFLMVYRSKKLLLSFALLSLLMGLMLLANHTQMIYYFIFVLLAAGIAELISSIQNKSIPDFAKRTGIIVLAVFIGFLTNFSNYRDTLSFSKYTMRGGKVITVEPEGKVKDPTVKKTKGLDPGYITYWSYGKQETYNLLVPNAKGSNPKTNKMFEELGKVNRNLPAVVYKKYQQAGGKGFGGYWGDQPGTSGPNYVGAIAVFLALLYLIFVHNPFKWAILGVTLLTILLSWGKNLGGGVEDMWLTNFFIENIPMYNKFRAVSTMLVVVNFTIPLMAILFLKKIMTDKEWAFNNLKKIGIAGGVIAFIVLLLAIVPSSFSFTNEVENQAIASHVTANGVSAPLIKDSLEEFRISVFKADSYRTFGFLIAALALLLLGVSKKVDYKFLVPILSVLVLADLLNVQSTYFNNEKQEKNISEYKYWQKKDGSQNTVRATQGDMAIFNQESAVNPTIKQEVAQRIQSERARLGSKFVSTNQESIMFSTLNFNTNYRVMDVDNPFNSSRASYFHKSTGGYHPAKLRRYQDMIDFYIAKEVSYLNTNEFSKMKVLNMLNNKYYLYQGKLIAQNRYAYGNAWFVNSIKWVEDNNSEILAIKETDVRNTAIVTNAFKGEINDVTAVDSNASIKMEFYQPNHIRYNSQSTHDGVAVFSEIYYKEGWNAYIDGEKVPHGRANYILRTLSIPSGKHVIDFKFEADSFKFGNTINMLGFLVIIIAFLLYLFFEYKNGKNEEIQPVDEQ